MDNKEEKNLDGQEIPEFDLDEIMKEFAEVPGTEEDGPSVAEQIGDLVTQTAQEPRQEAEEPEAVTGDTIRLDDLADVAPTAESAPEEQETADTEAPEEPEEAEEAPQEKVEPFSENWEPQYENPMGEYVPPAPIPFRPRQRLRELKKKLIAGPEKRYYDLSEMGLGKLQAAIFVNILIVLLCAGAAALYAGGMIPANRMRLMIFSQILAMLVSALLGCYVLMDGVADLFRGRFSLNTMMALTFVACCVDAVFCLKELRVPCCAAFSLEITMSLWNRYEKRNTEMGMMDTMRKATRLYSVTKVADYHEGRPALLRGEGQVEDFMDSYDAVSGPEKVQSVFAFISLLLCIGISVLAGMRHGLSLAVQVLSTALLAAVPASFFVALSRPMAVLERRLHMVGTVLCGWKGIKGMRGKAAFPLTDEDLFPKGSVKLNGVKFYGELKPDDVVAYAAALMNTNGGNLAPVFDQLLKSRAGQSYPVENFQSYPAGGIGGEVCGEPVLLGSLDFLQDMGVEIPEGTMVSQAVYCSIDGNLSAVFAISYGKLRSAAGGMVAVCGCRKLRPTILCQDFMMNESFLRSRFSVSTRRVVFPERAVRLELAKRQPGPEDEALALTTQEGLVSVAYAVTGAQALRTACTMGLIVHMAAGILGMLIMAALAYIGSTELLTPVNVLLYQLVWMIPGLLVTCWTKTV